MTEIKSQVKLEFTKQSEQARFEFECKGHCEHDVCVSVSALVSTLVQLIIETEAKVKKPEIVYKSGNVSIVCICDRVAFECRLRQKIEAIMTGFELFESNYPDEIKLTNGGVVFENSENYN